MKKVLMSSIATAIAIALASNAFAAGSPKPQTRNRAEIPAEYRWDFSLIYPSWEAWEAGMKELDGKIDELAKLQGSFKKGPAAILKYYQMSDDAGKLLERTHAYPRLQRDVDTRNQEISGKYQRVNTLYAKLGTATSWVTPELLSVPEATMRKWISQSPALKVYQFPILDSYRQQKHVLDEKGEKLMSLSARFSGTPTATFQELSTSDIKFPKITLADGKEVALTPGNYQGLLATNFNQADRAKAFEAYLNTYGATANTYAAIYNGILQRGWFRAQARNFPTTLEAALDGNDIPPSVVTTLIGAVREGTKPLQRYMALRKKLLKLDSYHLYDGSLPIYKTDKVYTYDDSKALSIASVAPLGPEYTEKFKKYMSGKQVDVYENDGKASGAYVSPVYGVGPYLKLNHNDTQAGMFTVAHEGGHAMHTILSMENQPYITADYTIFVAEVASTINERFLLNQLLQNTSDPKERFLLLQHAVDSIVQTFYTQVLFADYELQAHKLVEQGKPITAQVLNGIYLGLLKDYYGDAIVADDLYKYTWSRIPHFFNSPYYVYQYATCFASSAKLFKDMTTGDASSKAAATERYLTLLKSGGNDHPMKQLQKAGVDLSKRETIQAVIDQMNELVTQMEVEAAKIN